MQIGTGTLRNACALGLLALAAGPAAAQIWIGQIAGEMAGRAAAASEEACRNGAAMPEAEVTEAREPAVAAMTGYFDDARGERSFAERFHLDKRSQWSSGEVTATATQVGRQADPFAAAGLAFDPAPIGFVRSGDGSSALGQWVVRDAAGARAGTYTGHFTRKSGVWRLSTLALSSARDYAEPVVQYCHKVGDVLPHRLESTAATRTWLERQVGKHEKRLQAAMANAAELRAKADKPNASDLQRAQAREEAVRARRIGEQLEDLRIQLAAARQDEAATIAEAKALEDARAAARQTG